MNLRLTAGVAAALCILAVPAQAQSGRTAILRSAPKAPPKVPVSVLGDGSVIANFGRGYERLIRSCAAYRGGVWPGGQAHHGRASRWPQGGSGSPAPQGGSASPPPGANGLPPAPGLSPVPDAVGQQRVGISVVTKQRVGVGSVGSGSLSTLHSGWRTAGPAYYDGACYVQDRDGRLRLIQL